MIHLLNDMWQGLFLLMFLSYLLVALSALLNQSAAIYERGSLYSSLRMMGTEAAVLNGRGASWFSARCC